MAGLALVFDRGDRLIIDSIDEDAIPNAVPLIEPVCGAHLDLDTETWHSRQSVLSEPHPTNGNR